MWHATYTMNILCIVYQFFPAIVFVCMSARAISVAYMAFELLMQQ